MGPKLLKISDLSDEEREANEALIAKYNKKLILNRDNLPLKEKDKDKDAKEGISCYGIKSTSILCNKDIELLFIAGYMERQKGSYYFYEKNQITKDLMFFPYPAFAVIIKNNSNSTLYIDLANSFHVSMNGNSFSYYTPSSTTQTSSQQKGAGVNLGAISNALGINGVVGTLAQGINVGGGSTSGSSTTSYAQRVIAIAPNSTYNLAAHTILGETTQQIMGNIYPSEAHRPLLYDKETRVSYGLITPAKIGDCIIYEETISPFTSIIVAYSHTEDCKNITQIEASVYLKDEIGSTHKYEKHIFNNIRFEE